jgi:hypothetical protein
MPNWEDRIRYKLKGLKAADPDFQCFGAHRHQYRLGPTLSEHEVLAAEVYYGIEQPPDYRAFLTRVANGGAGPGYGLGRFGTPAMLPDPSTVSDEFSADYWGTVRHLAKDRGLLARRCPLHQTVQRAEMNFPTDDDAYEKWHRDVWARLDDGMLDLADYGCGMTAKLVITGPRRGTVWVADECDGEWIAEFRDCASAIGSGEPQPKPYGFIEWYEHWLDQELAEVSASG